ncbi:MAG: pyridoxal-phosphate dependent enzyme [Planctomycetota bacterium]|nr:pyridoxal-phosphate dependent enzyme [Planctomycetota bacterium]
MELGTAEQPGGNSAVTFGDVLSAAETIRPFVHRTPVIRCESLNELAQASLHFKCENLQKVGAFKFRGACNAVFRLSDADAQKGVVTHSSGNHAQALALAARKREIQAHIVMPSNAPKVKRDAVIGYGANVIECAPNLEARESTAEKVKRETGATFIHPYDHPHVIAGQGTAALELLEETGRLESIIAPVGGGGLISGTCLAVSGHPARVEVFAAEPLGADDAARSKAANRRIPQQSPNTIADGLLTSLGELTWPFVRDNVQEVITVTEAEIIEAMKLFWTRTKCLIEPSSATAVAVALQARWPPGSEVGIILSGGNVDLENLPWT